MAETAAGHPLGVTPTADGEVMAEVTILGYELELGLFLTEGDPNLTFIYFIGLTLLSVLGFRFGYYAHRNRRATDIAMQMSIWWYLQYIGLFAGLYGVVGLVEIISSIDVVAKNGLILATTLFISFAIHQIYVTSQQHRGAAKRSQTLERVTRGVFIAAIIVYVIGATMQGITAWTAGLEGISALGFVLYGIAYFHEQTAQARLQGTLLDSLLRHLVPVLTFASLVSIVAIAIPFGLPFIVVLHVQIVFIIMTATALMTATIKLRQNLAGL